VRRSRLIDRGFRGTTLAARGWTQEGGDLWETLSRLDREGCARYVVTDVTKDGMLKGPNLALLRDGLTRLLTDSGLEVVAVVADGDALVDAVERELLVAHRHHFVVAGRGDLEDVRDGQRRKGIGRTAAEPTSP